MGVLEDGDPSHQPRRQRWATGAISVNRAQPFLQQPPVDAPGQLGQRVREIDDLVKARPQQILLAALVLLAGSVLRKIREGENRTAPRRGNLQESGAVITSYWQIRLLAASTIRKSLQGFLVLHDRLKNECASQSVQAYRPPKCASRT